MGNRSRGCAQLKAGPHAGWAAGARGPPGSGCSGSCKTHLPRMACRIASHLAHFPSQVPQRRRSRTATASPGRVLVTEAKDANSRDQLRSTEINGGSQTSRACPSSGLLNTARHVQTARVRNPPADARVEPEITAKPTPRRQRNIYVGQNFFCLFFLFPFVFVSGPSHGNGPTLCEADVRLCLKLPRTQPCLTAGGSNPMICQGCGFAGRAGEVKKGQPPCMCAALHRVSGLGDC